MNVKSVVVLFLTLIWHLCAAEKTSYNQTACESACSGDRDSKCLQRTTDSDSGYVCLCMSGYFTESEKQSCRNECGNRFWSIFTYGYCTDLVTSETAGLCTLGCAFTIRLWATVFIVLAFAAAVVILVTMLPLCCASCKACRSAMKQEKRQNKENSRRRYLQATGLNGTLPYQRPVNGQEDYDVISPSVSTSSYSRQPLYPMTSGSPSRNPYFPFFDRYSYWAHYYYK